MIQSVDNASSHTPPLQEVSKNTTVDLFNFSFSEAVLILEEHLLSDQLFEGITRSAILSGYVILIVAGAFTNLLVALVIVGNSKLRVARNLFIVSLSISDMMLCIFCMPFTLVELLQRKWNLGEFLCRGVPFVQGITIFVSSATVSAIAIDRQEAIVSFRSQKVRDKSNMTLYTSILWIFSLVLALPICFSKTITSVSLVGMVLYQKCIEQWPSDHAKAIYTVIILVAQFVLPSLVLLFTHFRVKSHLNNSMRRTNASESPRTSERLHRELKRNNRATLVLFFITVVFAFSWLPWNVFNLMADFDLLTMVPEDFYLTFAVCHLVAMTSCITNPILYGWFNNNIRKEILNIRLAVLKHAFGQRRSSQGSTHCENTYIRSSGKNVFRENGESQL